MDGHLLFFPGVLRISRENTLLILASKCTKCKTAKSGAITLMWRKTAQKAEISQTSIFLCFFNDAGIYMYVTTFTCPPAIKHDGNRPCISSMKIRLKLPIYKRFPGYRIRMNITNIYVIWFYICI